ncbi:TVP38/TMEM64 family protein [Anaerococcus sp.]|uniref:TVP38/TMEM64 family protein n=1 Tax=Anaerococcus sp. TaxID=1872515 RepID=UPI002902ECF1|nr:TVP38/TMEM64 family protein [Anaerococcus sp.]MDU2598179.1 TVP38/TMEM64 family protein [Anaerococcus sp.]
MPTNHLENTDPKEERLEKSSKLAVLIPLAILILAYFLIPSFRNGISNAVRAISTGGLSGVIEYIRGFGKKAAVISFLLMILQSIVAPIPAVLITLANAAIFGWVKGSILSWSSAMVGAALCFFIARSLGRDAVIKLSSKGALENIEDFFARYGNHTILIARLLPFISFDVVSYAAGLTSMDFWGFFLATGLGQLPATIVYSYTGGELDGGVRGVFMFVIIISILAVAIAFFRKRYNEKHKTSL